MDNNGPAQCYGEPLYALLHAWPSVRDCWYPRNSFRGRQNVYTCCISRPAAAAVSIAIVVAAEFGIRRGLCCAAAVAGPALLPPTVSMLYQVSKCTLAHLVAQH